MNGKMPNGHMAMKGVKQGDMSPHVEDIQRPESNFSQAGFSKTLDYTSRHNAYEGKEASEIRGQAYQGRYS